MTILREASTMYTSMFSLILFLFLFESRYRQKKTLLLSLCTMGPLMMLNFILLLVLGPQHMSTLMLVTCSLPSLIFFWFLSKHRDGRFFFTFCFADTIVLEVLSLTAIADFFLGNSYIFMAVSRLLLCPVLTFLCWKWMRPFYRNLQQNVSNGWYTFTFISLLFYILMSVSSSVPTPIAQRPEQIPAFLLLLLLIPIIYLHIFTTLYQQKLAHETAEKDHILSIQMASLMSRVEEFRAANDLLRQERHDFRHIVRTAATLIENREYEKLHLLVETYLQSLGKPPLENYSSHTLLDAVLSSYLQEAKRKNIHVCVKAAFPGQLPVNESELATVLANAIENAIHACEKIPEGRRFIELRVIDAPCFMLSLRNSFDGFIAFDDQGIPLSSRKEHGFGTRSIVAFCEKSDAFFEFKAQEQTFVMKIIFP